MQNSKTFSFRVGHFLIRYCSVLQFSCRKISTVSSEVPAACIPAGGTSKTSLEFPSLNSSPLAPPEKELSCFEVQLYISFQLHFHRNIVLFSAFLSFPPYRKSQWWKKKRKISSQKKTEVREEKFTCVIFAAGWSTNFWSLPLHIIQKLYRGRLFCICIFSQKWEIATKKFRLLWEVIRWWAFKDPKLGIKLGKNKLEVIFSHAYCMWFNNIQKMFI